MDINNIEKAKELIDNYLRLKEIENHLSDGGDIVVTKHDKDTEDNYGVGYISKNPCLYPRTAKSRVFSVHKTDVKIRGK